MSDEKTKPILCLDFDGVIHRYDSGWQGACVIADDVTDGFFEWLDEAAQHFKIVVYSSRSKEPGAVDAMAFWMADQRQKWRERGGISPVQDVTKIEVEFAETKPPAFLQIDDRAICFDGDWSKLKPEALLAFKPWNKRRREGVVIRRTIVREGRDYFYYLMPGGISHGWTPFRDEAYVYCDVAEAEEERPYLLQRADVDVVPAFHSL